LQDENSYNRMSKAINPYGDGIASKRIVNAILKYYELTDHEVDEFKR
ncbi:UDP-N-acetylglucosamine 2-epimerase (non-hydrolyzing), partial [Clostridioides difficile]|nr:UDP-N-acetylglucosamine 2-epimerase (non-hydrolyzing) [Clostridioides difficile]